MAQTVKNALAMWETWVCSLVGKIPWRRDWLPTAGFLPGEFHGQRSLAGYSPWDHKELDMTLTPVLLPGKSHGGPWWAAVHGVAKSWTRLSNFTFTFHFHALEKEMATHSSVLAWRIPGTAEPGGLPSMGSHRVGHNWSDLAAAAAEQLLLQPSPVIKQINMQTTTGYSPKHKEYVSKVVAIYYLKCLVFNKSHDSCEEILKYGP